MTSLYLVIGVFAVIVLLAVGLAIAIKVAQAKSRKLKETESALENAKADLRRQGEYQTKREEAQTHADEKKESLHTGDSAADFNNSLNVLHGAGKNRGS
jgi:Tfp pilus assembly protein PilX